MNGIRLVSETIMHMNRVFYELSLRRLAGLLIMTASFGMPLRSAPEAELKDDSGKTIIRYGPRSRNDPG